MIETRIFGETDNWVKQVESDSPFAEATFSELAAKPDPMAETEERGFKVVRHA